MSKRDLLSFEFRHFETGHLQRPVKSGSASPPGSMKLYNTAFDAPLFKPFSQQGCLLRQNLEPDLIFQSKIPFLIPSRIRRTTTATIISSFHLFLSSNNSIAPTFDTYTDHT